MISLDLIPKIIFRPRTAFEELKDNTSPSEGILMLLIVSVISLMFFGVVANIVGINIMAFPFGFGYVLEPVSAVSFFGLQFFGILAASYIGNFVAAKFNGSGNFHETFAFICYGFSFNIVPAVCSTIALLWLKAQINLDISALNSGAIGSVSYMAALPSVSIAGIIVFNLWLLNILSAAFSSSHEISRTRGFVAAILGIIIMLIMTLLASQLTTGVLA